MPVIPPAALIDIRAVQAGRVTLSGSVIAVATEANHLYTALFPVGRNRDGSGVFARTELRTAARSS